MKMLKNLNVRTLWIQRVLPCLLALLVACISRYQLEISDEVSSEFLAGQWPVYAPVNILTAFCLTLLLFAVLGRWWLATGLSGLVFGIIALANYYTRDLHGSVLMPQDVLNAGTAANVLASYKLNFPPPVRSILLWMLPIAAIMVVQRWLTRDLPRRTPWRWRGVRVVVCGAVIFSVLYAGYFSSSPLVPVTCDFWFLQDIYNEFGYLAGTVTATSLIQDPILEPDGYSDQAAQDAAARVTGAGAVAASDEYPDIVMILSESLYDLDLVTDPQPDQEIFPVLNSLENAVHGHTVVPQEGGGTNLSEYEMLSSNSLMLMPSITPFNWLNLYGANSLVSYTKSLGYATMAAHPNTNSNYRRDSAWRALGFDETYFEDAFPTQEYYGNRPYQTDSASYKDFATLYEAMPEDQPRFAFLVSIQSHGDYDMNDASLDIVHAATDYGEYDAVMDEFLSCMKMSDEAVAELCAYFTDLYETTGRKVVVALAGDHAPSFVDHVADKSIAPQNELQILKRSTPFLIWANYPLENIDAAVSTTDPLNRMDMVMLAPTLLQQAGLPLSTFYQYLLEMKEVVPAFTNLQDYLDPTGEISTFSENEEAESWVDGYFYLQYNNIGAHAKRDQSLFDAR